MKLLTFSGENGGPRVGLADTERDVVRDLTGTLPHGVTLLDVVREWDVYEGKLAAAQGLVEYSLTAVTIHAPFPVPNRDIFCVGKNYREHVVEFGRSGYDSPDRSEALPEAPVVFPKMTTSVTGPYDDIESHAAVTQELDYEAELGVIIGRGGRGISRNEAFEHVWGYTIIDDFTARDLQRKHKQWLLGKSLDTHCPMGPFAVTRDEVKNPDELRVQSWVNGELRQDGSVADLIFDIPELIETISAGITLQPGDIIATGTPVGVGIGFDPPRFMKSGDVIEVAITGMGKQRNRIA
ncbi:fumarylacetoacetate hydrolase family protein [Janibacter sp. DB-40]|uniref:fumarylacetoacetate hydrolase family protein n=1 Tax=Janibacter sp. DB-40 TaxID=3028808 RepID=UPI002404E985|nr:fumarylacetoacetate hydrolase family protein [Janibacter sp. DB-40]